MMDFRNKITETLEVVIISNPQNLNLFQILDEFNSKSIKL